VIDQTGVLASDSGRPPGLTEVLTWKACGEHVSSWQGLQCPDIASERNSREMVSKNTRSAFIDFAKQLRLVAGSVKPCLDTSNAGKQTHDRE